MPKSVIVLGSINTDLVIRTSRLPAPGETCLGGEFYQAGGGKGANQAVAAARAALSPVTLLAAVGDDAFGRESLKRLRSENLRCDFIRQIVGIPSGVAFILVDAVGQNQICVASGANLSLSPDDVTSIPDEVFQEARVFIAGLEVPLETVQAGLIRARAFGLLTVFNPAPANDLAAASGLLELVDVLVPNEIEAAQLARAVAHDDLSRTPSEAAHLLNDAGCRHVIVTLGREGCLISSAGTLSMIAGRAVPAIDATAAGDAFVGELAVGLSEGLTLEQAAQRANAAAALSVTRRGAQPSLPFRREIDASM